MRTFFISTLLLASFFTAAARAQSAHWEPSGGTLDFDQDCELKLVFDNCTPKDDSVKPPPVEGLQLDVNSHSTGFSLINGQSSSSYTISYLAHPTKRGTLQLPAFTVATDKGDARVPAVSFDVDSSAAVSAGGNSNPTSSMADAAHSKLAPASGEFWAGEVFPISYTLDLARRYRPQGVGEPQWSLPPLTVEDWSKPDQFDLSVNGEPHLGVAYKTRGYAKTAGDITLPPVHQQVQLAIGGSPFDSFSFAFPRLVDRNVASNAPTLTIKPLPAAPEDFSGAVGKFALTAKVVPATVTVGEPITWTLTLNGTGNWPDIAGLPAREASQDFQVVPSKPKRELKNGSLFDATLSEDAVLVPSKPGSYTLPPVRFTYFDPKTGGYKTITTESFNITVAPAVENKTSEPAVAAAAATTSSPKPPGPPATIPRDPLAGTANAPVPWSMRTLTIALVAPFALLLIFWLGLALHRAHTTDPRRAQREAHARLKELLAGMRAEAASGSKPDVTRLLQWQHDAAVLAQLRHAAPPAEALNDQTWQQLWQETEHALYAADNALPTDWLARAEAALNTRRAPGFSPASLLLPRNLLPFAVALTILFLGFSFPRLAADETSNLSPSASLPGAGDASAAYRSGDFVTAEAGWRDALAQAPTNWIARHNLGLALAQQDRWPEAAAQWSAAFAQHPADDTLRWNLALGYEHAGYVVSDLVAFTTPGPLQQIARLASPAEWQRLLAAAAALAALALALLLARGYGLIRSWINFVALFALALSLVTAAAAGAGIRAYG
ncbi:MAG TPA: BatD family protein, partial [Opitutaceae bacterium]|nr:BatD family protein [Opitutaceae bacterium]